MYRSCAAIVSACFFAAAAPPPPPDLPEILLSAPINATWAANHVDDWNARGIDGFFLHGILDECAGNVWARDGVPETTGLDDLLLLEIRVANARLGDGGVSSNFLATRLPDAFQGFQREAEANALVEAFGRLAAFTAAAGLRGIALDTQSTALFHHPQWDGYASPEPAALHVGAMETGRRLYAAMAAAHPEAELLVIYDGPQSAGPLWPSFMSGLIHGVQRARRGSVHLLSRATFGIVEPRPLAEALRLEQEYFALRLDPAMYETWKSKVSQVPGLRPLMQPMPGGEIYAAYPPESFRTQLTAALLCAPRYIWIESAGQTWWQVAPEEAASYAGLYQLGDAIAAQTKPLPSYLEAPRATSPLEGLRRVTSLMDTLDEPAILAGAKGAAAVVWPGQQLVLTDDEQPRYVIDLTSGKSIRRGDGAPRIIEAAEAPLLVEGLSVADRMLAAAIWLDFDTSAVESWSPALPLRYGFTNHTPFTLDGVLDLFAPARWPAAAVHQDFALEPTAGVAVSTLARGRWRAGDVVTFRAGVTLAGATPKSRAWTIDVPPRLAWKAIFDAPVAGDPRWADVNADGVEELIVTTSEGGLACFTEHGAMRWAHSIRPGFAFGPLTGRAPAGWHAIAAVDTAGKLYVLRGDGMRVMEVALPAHVSAAPAVADLHPWPGDELVLMLESGVVQLWRLDGVMLWEHDTGGTNALVSTISEVSGEPWIVCAGSDIEVMSGTGESVARAALPEPATCAAAIGNLDHDDTRDILVGTASGAILRIEDEEVTSIKLHAIEGRISGIHIAEPGLVLVASETGVHALSHALEHKWTYAAPGAQVRTVGNTIVVTASGTTETVGLNAEGVVQWTDASPLWGPLTAPAISMRGEALRIAVGSGEGVVRVRELVLKQ